MIPLELHGSNMKKDPINHIDEAYQIVAVMGFLSEEKVELWPIN